MSIDCLCDDVPVRDRIKLQRKLMKKDRKERTSTKVRVKLAVGGIYSGRQQE